MRSSIASLIVVSFVFAGCSSAPPGDNVSTENESALTTSCTSDTACDPTLNETGIEFVLSTFDGTTLTGANSKGAFSAHFLTTTSFRTANLDKYLPQDPCRADAVSYNAAVSSTSVDASVFTSVGSMATHACTAQVWISAQDGSIRAIRPKAP